MRAFPHNIHLQNHTISGLRDAANPLEAVNLQQLKTLAAQTKSVSILSPTGTEEITLFYVPYAANIKSVEAVMKGTTPAVTLSMYAGTDRTSSSTTLVNSQALSSTTTGDGITVNTAIAAGSFVWMVLSAPSGSITELHITVQYEYTTVYSLVPTMQAIGMGAEISEEGAQYLFGAMGVPSVVGTAIRGRNGFSSYEFGAFAQPFNVGSSLQSFVFAGTVSPTPYDDLYWKQVEYVLDSDDATYSYVQLADGNTSDALWLEGLINIPMKSTSTIRGLEVTIRRDVDATDYNTDVEDNTVQLTVDGVASGNNKATPGVWSTTPTDVVYGGPADLWGLTITPETILSNIGLLVKVEDTENSGDTTTARVYSVSVRVYWSNEGRIKSREGYATVSFSTEGLGDNTQVQPAESGYTFRGFAKPLKVHTRIDEPPN